MFEDQNRPVCAPAASSGAGAAVTASPAIGLVNQPAAASTADPPAGRRIPIMDIVGVTFLVGMLFAGLYFL